jgi:hypothetical protein
VCVMRAMEGGRRWSLPCCMRLREEERRAGGKARERAVAWGDILICKGSGRTADGSKMEALSFLNGRDIFNRRDLRCEGNPTGRRGIGACPGVRSQSQPVRSVSGRVACHLRSSKGWVFTEEGISKQQRYIRKTRNLGRGMMMMMM